MQCDVQTDDLLNFSIRPNECLEEAAGPSSKYGFAALCQAQAARGIYHPYRYISIYKKVVHPTYVCVCVSSCHRVFSKLVKG